jgi:hypothetical protein
VQKSFDFLTKGLTGTLNSQQIVKKADLLENQVRLAMHGVPFEITRYATRDELNALWQIVYRDEKDQAKLLANIVGLGVWGDGRSK